MTFYLSGRHVLAVGSRACGFTVTVGESAQFDANIARPATSAFGEDAFVTVWEKGGGAVARVRDHPDVARRQ